jgi:hypothetical protein
MKKNTEMFSQPFGSFAHGHRLMPILKVTISTFKVTRNRKISPRPYSASEYRFLPMKFWQCLPLLDFLKNTVHFCRLGHCQFWSCLTRMPIRHCHASASKAKTVFFVL